MTEGLDSLPPSAKLVYKVLEYEEPLTQQEIVEETRLPEVTVRTSLPKLEQAGSITRRHDATDARQKVYATVK